MKIFSMGLYLFVSFPLFIGAQEKEEKSKPGVYSIISAGYLFGESDISPGFNVITGIDLQKIKLGIGGGYDGYRFNSFPVFADIRRDFGERKKFFGFINGGYHIPKGEETFDSRSYPSTEKWQGGLYADAGLGFRFKLGKKNNLLFSSSYNFKKVRHIKTYVYPCLVPPCPGDVYKYEYGLNYISTRLSWEFKY